MKKDLVTGATGFIGRHLAERLVNDQREVKLLCRPQSILKLPRILVDRCEIIPGDIRDPEALRTAVTGVERVFHCAAHVSDWGDEETFTSTNVHATEMLLRESLKHNLSRFVHLSSIAVFGVPSPRFFDDTTPYGNGLDLYSRTKIRSEQIALGFHREHGLPVTVLRPAVVYGPHGTWSEEPLNMIRKNKMFLLDNGSGTCHPCYIHNLVDAMILAAEHSAAIGQAFIVSDGESITFNEYFNYLARIAGARPIRRSIPLPLARSIATICEKVARLQKSQSRPLLTHMAIDMVTARSEMSVQKIFNELGFKPRFTVHSAMEDLKNHLAFNQKAA